MTHDDLKKLEEEIREVGQAARTSQHPLVIAGVLLRLYERSTLSIDRTALAYVISQLLESIALQGAQEKE